MFPLRFLPRSPGVAATGLLVWLALAAGSGLGCRTPVPAAASGEAGTIPILAWHSIPADHTSADRFRELAEAGFTVSFSGYPSADAQARALDLAHAAGVRLMIHCPELQSDPEGTVRRFKDHPALAGYSLRDEPHGRDFAELAAWVRRIRAVDDRHPCYINLFPTYASAQQLGHPTYRAHVQDFLRTVPVQVLSFDHYPVVGDRIRADWYENLEIIREEARSAELPFWAFALSVAHDPYPVATVASLRLQMFSNLAYGASTLQYFTYWTPEPGTWNFHQGPLERDGTRTAVYDRVRQVNEEIQRLAPWLAGAEVTGVGHVGSVLPRGTRAFTPAAPVIRLDTQGRGAVVSRFRQGAWEGLAVVNRELQAPLDLELELSPTSGTAHAVDPASGKPRRVKGGRFSDRLEPGDLRLVLWRAGDRGR